MQEFTSQKRKIESEDSSTINVENQIARQTNSAMIGTLLQEAGIISPKDIDAILQHQKTSDLSFGDAALAMGLVSHTDIQKVLSQQFKFPYLAPSECSNRQDLIAAYQPFSKQAEALRSVRSQLMLKWFNANRKTLALISPARNEGCSYLCANLAIVFAQLGAKTLLVDANLRRPKQHKLFELDRRRGLSDLLGGREITMHGQQGNGSIIFKSAALNNLSIFPAGTIPPNPVELIGRGFKNCLRFLQLRFDVILIDTPAAELGVEAQIIAKHCEGALLVARQNKTQLKDLQALKFAIENTGSNCLGVIMSEFEDSE